MQVNWKQSRLVTYQNLGFLAVIALCYLDEFLKLPSLIFSDHPLDLVYRRPMLQMLLILAVWLLVNNSTRRLLKRVHHLEDFMRVCAWCRRIEYHGDWMRLEEFMEQGYDTPSTHGICPECLQRQTELIQQAIRRRQAEG
jgi:hypothetical protein